MQSELQLPKTCIVTGAGSGLGRAITLGLAEAGVRIVAADLDLSALQAWQTGAHEIMPYQVDLASPEACDGLAERFADADVLVNCAGLNMAIFSKTFLTRPVPFWEIDPSKWQLLYDVNVRAPFLLARRLAPHMIERKWGRIVNVTTSFSSMLRAGNTPYGQAKSALESATAVWAADLEGTGVTVNALIPGGAANTPMIPFDAQMDRSRLVDPSAMVAPMVYLIASVSDGVTGMRLDASKWKAGEETAVNFGRAARPAAWPELATGHVRPVLDAR